MMKTNIFEEALSYHEKNRGKIAVTSKVPLNCIKDLSLAYTPGVAQPCIEIAKNPEQAYLYTSKGNIVAVITDGTAVLGLGNIGPEAAMPVMEGKALLFKKFADIDAIPICVSTTDPDEFVQTVEKISKSFGGINLEDISSPRCFEIERRLKESLDIPVFHDDQHGTAVVVIAAMINAMKLTNKRFDEISIVINGAGAAGIAIVDLLIQNGVKDIIVCDRTGIIYDGREDAMLPHKVELAKKTNFGKRKGGLEEAVAGMDVFIGVSEAAILSKEMVKTMAENPIIFGLANPFPEILPHEALEAGAAVVCTGRSDFPNQVNNALAFPGIFRGALNVRAKAITEGMKQAAAKAIADLVSDQELRPDYIIPGIFDERVAPAVAQAVELEAKKEGSLLNL